MSSDVLGAVMGEIRAEALALLRERSVTCRFPKGATLYSQSDPADCIFVIEQGCVIVERMSASGDVTSYRIALRGDVLGHRSYFAGEHRSTAPRCITDTVAVKVPAAALAEAMSRDPGIGLRFARALARDDGPKLGAMLRGNRTLGIVRLACLLHYLHARLAGEPAVGTGGDMPFTQNDLANMLGLRYETVSRLIHQLQDRAVIDVASSPRRIVIKDHAALLEIIGDEH
ncbi:Crp/Fnr family transcriptional regulator [Limibaculum sp. M0105]|uniref:Crp/Fnr family transcriptional regulator n=1 Tax=Thermohalobaculum xanthum TaxID=2753746 RepID=A0A8J7SFY4_9RHOB|nr:Crp/Fnr family transcriptional regulator [Thermohalobaculum xanthum]MBK0400456.1 Crp/Fnr family transcriptional regulator [Thermohalobaculum xanthum]